LTIDNKAVIKCTYVERLPFLLDLGTDFGLACRPVERENMKDRDFQRWLGDAIYFQSLSGGNARYFWEGYELGLRNYHDQKFISESDDPDMDEEKHSEFMIGDDLESLGYRAGFAGLSSRKALAIGKRGIYNAGLNGNFHKGRSLGELGVIYKGQGKWTLPKGAKIYTAQNIESYYRCQYGDNWELKLADGSMWIVYSEDILPAWHWDDFVNYFLRQRKKTVNESV